MNKRGLSFNTVPQYALNTQSLITHEAYALQGDAWREIGWFAGGARVSVVPFEAVTISLDDLWPPT